MSPPPIKLDPYTFTLRGVQVIEASAGTGKTWTLAALYLRLVLGDGRAPLEPRQILVMTFTDAAMEELRERIRERLAQAARVFHRDALAEAKADDFLLQLRDSREPNLLGDALRLDTAARSMDEAAIFTIHGWSHRMLREHAFESVSLFEQRKIEDPHALQQQVLHDYWRLHVYTLSPAQTLALTEFASSPDDLLSQLRKRLSKRSHQPLLSQLPAKAAFTAAFNQKAQWLTDLATLETKARALWTLHRLELESQLEGAYKNDLNGTSYGITKYAKHMRAMQAWAQGDDSTDQIPAKFSLAGLKVNKGKNKPLDHFGVYQTIADLEALRAAAPDTWEAVYDHAAEWISAESTRRKLQRGEFDFQDLLQRLHHALTTPGSGLPALIRQQYPVALVDEFQDTDKLQYGALQHIYIPDAPDDEPADTALMLIGDPKQAIYSFRGADLQTYLQARAAAKQVHTLSGNFRSSKPLVDAVNHVFSTAHLPFANIGYEPVTAERAASVLSVPRPDGTHWPALTVWTAAETGPCKAMTLRDEFAEGMASQIVALLQEGQVAPADIAVLVRTGKEAGYIRKALQERAVATVYLSERDSVYRSPQALQLWYVLAAVLKPRSLRAIRSAVATRLYGLSAAEREQVLLDDQNLEALIETFLAWQDMWRTQGVLAMVHQLLHQRGVAAQCLAQTHTGERELTNVLHLAALLQEASAGLQGETALLRFLSEQIGADDNSDSGASQLRLETDAALVKVITLHKSKGLQYPVVFLPFAYEPPYEKGLSTEEKLAQQAESVRLLYVAMTRAQRALFLAAATPKIGYKSAPLYTLLNRKGSDDLIDRLNDWQCSDIHIEPLPPSTDHRWTGTAAAVLPRNAETPQRRHRSAWRSSSFSSMTRDLPKGTALPKTAQDELREYRQIDAEGEANPLQPTSPWSALKGSERLGTAMHDLLECQLHEAWPAQSTSPTWQKLLRRHARNLAAEKVSAEQLQDWVQVCTHAQLPLPEGPLQLRTLTSQHAVAEMPFVLSVGDASTRHIDDLLHSYVQPGQPRTALSRETLQGQLVGSLDLVLEHQGRWYVLDYKTNQISTSTQQAMTDKILEKRYDLQYSLYLLALHRLLKARLTDYDYDRHIGGALYFFLRLVDQPGCGLYHDKPPRQFIEALDRHFCEATA